MRNISKALKNILWVMLSMFEAVVFIGIIGASTEDNKGDILSSLPCVISSSAAFGFLFMISLGGIVREKMEKKLNFITNTFMRLFIIGTGLTVVLRFTEEDDLPYELLACFQGVCIILGICSVLLGRKANKLSPKIIAPGTNRIDNFEIEKAEWLWDAAASEYYRGAVPEDMSESDNDLIYNYASMPMACYLLWLLHRGMVSEDFCDMVSEDVLESIRNGSESPVAFLAFSDYCFTRDMISDEVYNFTNTYYWGNIRRSGFQIPYNSYDAAYQFDYFHIVGNDRYYYVNSYSWETQQKLEEVLDKRLREYREDIGTAEKRSTEYSDVYHWELDVELCYGADENDLKAVLDDVLYPDAQKLESVRRCLAEHAEHNFSDEEYEELFDFYSAYLLKVYHSEDGRPAYVLDGYCGYDCEESFSLTVRGDIVYSDPESDSEIPPYSEHMEMLLSLMHADPSDGRNIALIPCKFGGSQGADNTLYMPSACADIKERCDNRIACLLKQGTELSYTCEPMYKDGRVNGFTVTAKDPVGRVKFSESAELK